MKIGAVKAVLYLRTLFTFYPYLLYFNSVSQKKAGTGNLVTVSFLKISALAAVIYLPAYMNFCP
jgi:hypothetical protein